MRECLERRKTSSTGQEEKQDTTHLNPDFPGSTSFNPALHHGRNPVRFRAAIYTGNKDLEHFWAAIPLLPSQKTWCTCSEQYPLTKAISKVRVEVALMPD